MSAALEVVAAGLAAGLTADRPLTVGVTGSVAAGKSTFSVGLKTALPQGLRVEIVATDGYLFPNAVLDASGLSSRKGFPETYDVDAMMEMLSAVRTGSIHVPTYNHQTYDTDPGLGRMIDRPDILNFEGLGLAPRVGAPNLSKVLDRLIYIDAAEDDLETWFVTRFLDFRASARTNPGSFYVRFLALSDTEARAFAQMVWREINLPNLREHISRAKEVADIVLMKDQSHALHFVRGG